MLDFGILRCFLVSIFFLTGLFVNCGHDVNEAEDLRVEKPLMAFFPGSPVEMYTDYPRMAVSRSEGDGRWAVARKTVIISAATITISNRQSAIVTPSPTPEEQDRATIRLIFLLVGGLVVLMVVMIVVVVMVMKKLKNLA